MNDKNFKIAHSSDKCEMDFNGADNKVSRVEITKDEVRIDSPKIGMTFVDHPEE